MPRDQLIEHNDTDHNALLYSSLIGFILTTCCFIPHRNLRRKNSGKVAVSFVSSQALWVKSASTVILPSKRIGEARPSQTMWSRYPIFAELSYLQLQGPTRAQPRSSSTLVIEIAFWTNRGSAPWGRSFPGWMLSIDSIRVTVKERRKVRVQAKH